MEVPLFLKQTNMDESIETLTKPADLCIESASGKRWVVLPEPDAESMEQLHQIKGLNPVAAKLLVQRGISSEGALKVHFNPDLDQLHDPFLMQDMDTAVDRVSTAINSGEKIMIFGDYDVDGTTATALVYKYLLPYYGNLITYIPDRYAEGYGISFAGIDHAYENGVSLIIALDCGIKSLDKVLHAKAKQIDFIICDHHLPGPEIPAAIAVLDPKRTDCAYPFKELSGCGVGFKLLQGLTIKMGWEAFHLFKHLELVAISIASDIVPVTGENRVLLHAGLLAINEAASPGVQALIEVAGFKPYPDGGYRLKVDNLVFGIGPRINAAGRIAHGKGAVELLIAATYEEAKVLASRIDDQNVERKELDKTTTSEALAMIESLDNGSDLFSTVLFQPHWHKGVIGIVASRCIEKYHRPTIILTESNGKITGSGRSVFGFDLYQAIDACSSYLTQFGGHYFAAGLTMELNQLENFTAAFEEQVRSKMTRSELVPRFVADTEISLAYVHGQLCRQLQRLGPFGPGNMNPVFIARNLMDSGRSHVLVSKNGTTGHIKFHITSSDLQADDQQYAVEGIGFGLADHFSMVCGGKPFDLLFHIEENEFKGQKRIQLMVKDIRPSVTSLT